MPKPGKYNKPSWKNQYSEHDFRGNDTRRVTFKSHRGGKQNNKNWSASVGAYLQDEDIDMGITNTSGGGGGGRSRGKFGRGRGGKSGSPPPFKRKLIEGPTGWFRITLPFGNKYEKPYMLQKLLENITPLPFVPITWQTNGTAVTFYVDDFKVADKFLSLDRQIQLHDGFRLMIKVNSGTPNVDITTAMKEKIQLTMGKRYNAATRALDLSKFHADPDLHEYFCALFKPIIFNNVLDIIRENISGLEALSLDENKLTNIYSIKKFISSMPNLKILHLGKNKFRDLTIFDLCTPLPIIELVLNGNPLCNKFKDQTQYVRMLMLGLRLVFYFYSEVRKRFPKVLKLDGIELPPPISFDIEEDVPLPPKKQTFLCNQEGEGIVRQFLEQYFAIFDTENRLPLLQAYHESAMFSLTMVYPYSQKDKSVNWLNWYNTDNRNLLKVEDHERRAKLLKYGNVTVIAFLQDMPQTKHDVHSFTVDLSFFTPQMMTLTVTGLFKELKNGHKTPPIRHFLRTLVIVPAGSGFCIANDELHITNASESQLKNAFKMPIPAIVVEQSTPEPGNSLSTSTGVHDSIKLQMVNTMSSQSGMNIEWSKKCLEEVQWDYPKAILIFTDLQKQGIIPPEAFLNSS